jgi:hypothetical protein
LLQEPSDLRLAVRSKERTFHYLPYNFEQSSFEKLFIEDCLKLDVFQNKPLELYYNGERGLTELVIECYQKKNGFWKYLGDYTPDFILLERKKKQAHKILIAETKGKGFGSAFESRKRFMESDFLRLNAEKFGYARFDFLYLSEEQSPAENLAKLSEKIKTFFA